MTKPPRRLLILFAHPAFHKSRVNQLLLSAVQSLPGVTVNDLHEEYPNFHINSEAELSAYGSVYRRTLEALRDDRLDLSELMKLDTLNEAMTLLPKS